MCFHQELAAVKMVYLQEAKQQHMPGLYGEKGVTRDPVIKWID